MNETAIETTTVDTVTMNTAEAIVDSLIAHDVDTVFGIPGIQTYALFEALAARSDRIRLVTARHEQACAYMALGYAQSIGRTGVFTVVPGPGVLNASAGLLTALSTSSPVVGITSEIPTDFLGRGLGHLHEMPNQLKTLRTFTKWAENAYSPAEAQDAIAEAFLQARSGRQGPAVVAAPWDTMTVEGEVSIDVPVARQTARGSIDEEAIRRAAEALSSAQRPMIMVGGGARGAGAEIRALAERIQAPVVSFRAGRGIVSDDDPYGFSAPEGFELWGETDLLLAIGSRQDLVWQRWPDRPENLVVVNLDIDPRQQERLRPEFALTGDATIGTAQLLAALADVPERPSRLAELQAAKAKVRAELDELQPHTNLLRALSDAVPNDAILVDEASQMGFAAGFAFPFIGERRLITSGYQGNLGSGFPTALGVKVANPGKVVISITGDGGFLYGATELATAVRERIGLITIVFDNEAYGNVMADQERIYGRASGSALTSPDFVALARAFGADGSRAETPAELGAAVTAAVASGNPTVIHVPMPLDLATSPWRFLRPASRR